MKLLKIYRSSFYYISITKATIKPPLRVPFTYDLSHKLHCISQFIATGFHDICDSIYKFKRTRVSSNIKGYVLITQRNGHVHANTPILAFIIVHFRVALLSQLEATHMEATHKAYNVNLNKNVKSDKHYANY